MPIPFDIKDHYGKLPEEYWSDAAYHEGRDFKWALSRLDKLMNVKDGMKSLDIGAGLGMQMKALQDHGFDSYGLEPSEQFREHSIKHGFADEKKLQLSTIEDAKYDDNQFDFISFGVVLEHLYNPTESLKKAIGWLKPGGLMYVEVPSSDWLVNKIANFYYRLRGSDYVGNVSPMHEPYHLYEFTLKSFKEHAAKCNYSIVRSEYVVAKTYMPKFLDPLLKAIMKRTNTGMQLMVWLKKDS